MAYHQNQQQQFFYQPPRNIKMQQQQFSQSSRPQVNYMQPLNQAQFFQPQHERIPSRQQQAVVNRSLRTQPNQKNKIQEMNSDLLRLKEQLKHIITKADQVPVRQPRDMDSRAQVVRTNLSAENLRSRQLYKEQNTGAHLVTENLIPKNFNSINFSNDNQPRISIKPVLASYDPHNLKQKAGDQQNVRSSAIKQVINCEQYQTRDNKRFDPHFPTSATPSTDYLNRLNSNTNSFKTFDSSDKQKKVVPINNPNKRDSQKLRAQNQANGLVSQLKSSKTMQVDQISTFKSSRQNKSNQDVDKGNSYSIADASKLSNIDSLLNSKTYKQKQRERNSSNFSSKQQIESSSVQYSNSNSKPGQQHKDYAVIAKAEDLSKRIISLEESLDYQRKHNQNLNKQNQQLKQVAEKKQAQHQKQLREAKSSFVFQKEFETQEKKYVAIIDKLQNDLRSVKSSQSTQQKATFEDVLKTQIQDIAKYKSRIEEKGQQISGLKDTVSSQRKKIEELQNDIKINKLQFTTQLRQAEQKFQIQLLDKSNVNQTMKRTLETMEGKWRVAVKEAKQKDDFITNYLVGRAQAEEKDHIKQILKKYEIAFPTNAIMDSLLEQVRQIEQLKERIEQLKEQKNCFHL